MSGKMRTGYQHRGQTRDENLQVEATNKRKVPKDQVPCDIIFDGNPMFSEGKEINLTLRCLLSYTIG